MVLSAPVFSAVSFRHTHSAAGPRSSGAGFRPRPTPRSWAWFNRRGRSSSELPLRPAIDRRNPPRFAPHDDFDDFRLPTISPSIDARLRPTPAEPASAAAG